MVVVDGHVGRAVDELPQVAGARGGRQLTHKDQMSLLSQLECLSSNWPKNCPAHLMGKMTKPVSDSN